MEFRFLGKSGLKVSALSLGAWVTFGDQIAEDEAHDCMKAAIDQGVNFFDNAEVYAGGRAEEVMGTVIRKAGWKRSDLVIATKIFWGGRGPNDKGLSRKHIVEGTKASLERLQMDYVDLIFCHRPDLYAPVEETVRAMSHVVDQGLAFYWGTSEWSAEQIRQAYIARQEHLVPPTMEQPQYNMLCRDKVEREFARLYEEIGLGTTIWSPLASGMLTGKYNDGIPEGTRITMPSYSWLRDGFVDAEGKQKIAKVRDLCTVAQEMGCTMAQLAIAWCLKNKNVSTVITGASRKEQVEENMKALDVVAELSPSVMETIEGILANRPPSEADFRVF
jgi:voltage-dependent potassium channel beta subunit